MYLIVVIVFNLILLAGLIYYAVRYDLFQMFAAAITKNEGLLDRIRRKQMRKKAERRPLPVFLQVFDELLRDFGYNFLIPGELPLMEAVVSLLFAIDLFMIGYFMPLGKQTRLLVSIVFAVFIPLFGAIRVGKRTQEAEEQLSAFAKLIGNTSGQYDHLSDVFASHYMEFTGAFRYACEEFFIETSNGFDLNTTIMHFERKFTSPIIDVFLENFSIERDNCSGLSFSDDLEDDGDEEEYLKKAGTLAADIADAYVQSTKDNREIMFEARKRVTISFVIILILLIPGGLIVKDGLFPILFYGHDLYFVPEIELLLQPKDAALGIGLLIISVILYGIGIFKRKGF